VIRGKWPDRFVVDASVALKIPWLEANTDAARRFFAAAESRWAQLIAPRLWFLECTNGCWKRVARKLATPEEAVRALDIIRALPVVQIDDAEFQDTVIAIALRNRTTAYDSLYVATAQFADVPLVTADMRLVQLLKDAAWEGSVFHISQFGALPS
jgi:predicted nucleic acid-binding protein